MNPALLQYGRALRRRWRWVGWGLLLTLVATTLFLLIQPPLYRSQATVLVRTPGDVSRVLDGGDSYAQGRARTYSALASSTDLAARVIDNAGLDVTPEVLARRIRAAPRQGTALIDVSIEAPSADASHRTAMAFLAEYAATVRTLESVPGSLVPRAELVVVDPPGSAEHLVAWGPWSAPVWLVLLGATMTGLLLGATAAVLRSVLDNSVDDPRDAARLSGRRVLGSIGDRPGAEAAVDEHTIRYRLLAAMGNPDRGVITVTGSWQSSATTSTAISVARSLTESVGSVVLIDLDVLVGAGGALGTGTDLIDSPALRTIIGDLRENHAWVVLACPSPVHAAAIADASDFIVLAVRRDLTTEDDIREITRLLPTSAAVIFDHGGDPPRSELSMLTARTGDPE